MEKILLISFFTILTFSRLLSQTYYVDEELQKGYIKDGVKYKFWEYYNGDGELTLKINHSNGKVIYLRSDTSKYMIEIDGEWIYAKPSIPPTYIGSIDEFRTNMAKQITAPKYPIENNITGYIFFSFVVDSTGYPTNFVIEKDLCKDCSYENLDILIKNMGSWIPAHIDGKRYNSKFVFPLKIEIDGKKDDELLPDSTKIIYNGRLIDEIVLVAYGVVGSGGYHLPVDQSLTSLFQNKEYSNLQNALKNKNDVHILNLSSQNLMNFQNEIFQFIYLTQLNLRNNKIDSIPKNINKLRNIQTLMLDSNKLTNLPVKFKNLNSLSALSITYNYFESFPPEVLSLKYLTVLDISNNNINAIPIEIKQMRNLKSLAILNCGIKTLPEEFYQLKKLEKLYVDINQLDQITRERLKKDFDNLEILNE